MSYIRCNNCGNVTLTGTCDRCGCGNVELLGDLYLGMIRLPNGQKLDAYIGLEVLGDCYLLVIKKPSGQETLCLHEEDFR